MFGGDGNDLLIGTMGWDAMHGGNGTDLMMSWDGGDCLWGGAVDPDSSDKQIFKIYGTGLDEENYTIVMDFWKDGAVAENELCLNVDRENIQNNEEHYPFGTLPYCYSYGFGGRNSGREVCLDY